VDSADCGAGSAADAGPAGGAEPAADSGDAVGLGVGSDGGVRGVRIAFKPSEEISKKEEIILIISFIFSLKSLRINLFNSIINNFRFFIIIMIFFNNFLNFLN